MSRVEGHTARRPGVHKGRPYISNHVLPCHGGIGKTGVIAALSAGITTLRVRLRFWTMAEGRLLFWPLSAKVAGPPIMMCPAILVARIPLIHSAPLAAAAPL